MIVVALKRSNSKLQGLKQAFHNPKEADAWLQAQIEGLEEDDWQSERDKKSNNENGLITFTHPYERFTLFLTWRTLNS